MMMEQNWTPGGSPRCDCGQVLPVGQILCLECGDRLWQELHWLADLYDHLEEALTHRINVERAEQVKVRGAKDPLVQGISLNDDAAGLRHEIRRVATYGTVWIGQRGLRRTGLNEAGQDLRWVARNLHWILSDVGVADPALWPHWVVEVRLKAEELVTPAVERAAVVGTGQACKSVEERLDGSLVPCGGEILIWTSDIAVGVCSVNPGHLVSRETILREKSRQAQADRVKALLSAILAKPKSKEPK
jgi:hypothetical protein